MQADCWTDRGGFSFTAWKRMGLDWSMDYSKAGCVLKSAYSICERLFATDFLCFRFCLCFGFRALDFTVIANPMLTVFRGLGCRGAQRLEKPILMH